MGLYRATQAQAARVIWSHACIDSDAVLLSQRMRQRLGDSPLRHGFKVSR
jgi:hypothetical protein